MNTRQIKRSIGKSHHPQSPPNMKVNKFKEVSKNVFDSYIKEYQNELKYDVTGISEPPTGSFNDFTLGNWPESVVAKIALYDGSEYYGGQTEKYYILNDQKTTQA